MAINIVVPDPQEVPVDLDARLDTIEGDILSETVAREVGDALAVQRGNHEGTQPISTVQGLEEALLEASGPRSYSHPQGPPDEVWTINHNLGFNPGGIVVQDSAGTVHRPERIEYVDENTLKLYFRFAFGGTAELT